VFYWDRVNEPSCSALYAGIGFKVVDRKVDDSCQNGTLITEVFHRELDDTYWRAYYRRLPFGKTSGLREGHAKITQVIPVEKTVTFYVKPEGGFTIST